jgi:hypothetical protein
MQGLSVWHWLVVLLVLAIPGTVIYVAASRARAEGGVMTPGFKGWLFILAVSIWLGPLWVLGSLARLSGDRSPEADRFPMLFHIDLVIQVVALVLAVASLVLMLRRSSRFPTLYFVQASWAVVSVPLSLVAAMYVLQNAYGIPVTFGQMLEGMAAEFGGWLGGLLGIALWVVYILRSRRVAMTFTN